VDREHAHLVNDTLALLFEFASQALERRVGYFDPAEGCCIGTKRATRHVTIARAQATASFVIGFVF
jgi:hypothetical protein